MLFEKSGVQPRLAKGGVLHHPAVEGDRGGQSVDADLVATKASLIDELDADLRQYVDADDTVCAIDYPVATRMYPKSL